MRYFRFMKRPLYGIGSNRTSRFKTTIVQQDADSNLSPITNLQGIIVCVERVHQNKRYIGVISLIEALSTTHNQV